jgi:hypothetical protein
MRGSAYRTAWVSKETADAPRLRMGNRDLLPVFVAIWLVGAARLGLAFEHEEQFGTELTFIFATVVLIPVLLFSARFGSDTRSNARLRR